MDKSKRLTSPHIDRVLAAYQIIEAIDLSKVRIVAYIKNWNNRRESDNHSSWTTIVAPHILEKNASHECINVIGSTSISNNFHTVNDVYPKNIL